jgi:hypothetical protein
VADRHSQLRAQRRIFAGFPLNRPRLASRQWAAPWSAPLLVAAITGCQIPRIRTIEERMNTNHSRLIALLSAIVAAAALRLVPHPPNFTPIDAMALFSGAYLGRRGLAFAAPFGALLLSDAILGFYSGMVFQYFSVALIVLLGWLALSRLTVLRLGIAAVASSVLFFAISNFGVWLVSGMYPHDASGLAACYDAAMPFFRKTVAGDLFYTTLLFGGFKVAELLLPSLRAGKPQLA